MRRLAIAVAASAAAAVVAGSGQAQAQAAPVPRPVESVKAQLVPGGGVLISETARATYTGIKGTFSVKTTGSVGFGRAGNTDYDLVSRGQISPEAEKFFSEKDLERLRTPIHTIKVGRHTYVSGLRPDRGADDWLRFGGDVTWGEEDQRGSQFLDVLNVTVLKKLIAKAVSPRPGEYQGTITRRELYGERPWEMDVRKLSYRLFVGTDQLPVRLVTETSQKTTVNLGEKGKPVRRTEHAVVDTRYRAWGTRVTITAPSESEAVTAGSLMTQLFTPLSPVPIGPAGTPDANRPR
ncbi:hypothetical protein [Streptosporangium saharense]|uniref:DUF3108 domain-containing protein n=1 Tax=Streptosporangium saharense TaxID=1706840 RepID=A0A7W7QI17_9ACTN|nr:hypothetical protein [Streptosporangium saharense]MBB4913481.1 hypothetical protein [Streptosporangium saharense]